MKTKILVSALICASVGYVNAETPPPSSQKEKVMFETPHIDKIKNKVSNNDEPINSRNFDTKSKAEQNSYINKLMSERNRSFLISNLEDMPEPFLSENALKNKEKALMAMLIQCNEMIGPEDWEKKIASQFKFGDGKTYDFVSSKPFRTIYDDFDGTMSDNYRQQAQFHDLSNRVYKCIRYVYFNEASANRPSADLIEENYAHNFEYDRKLSDKESAVLSLYEKIYLTIKEAGLLSRMDNAYVPKSFLREHADKTGLTVFIKEKETQANHTLKHDELAIQFFGSRGAWLTSLHNYLIDKINFK